MVLFKLFFWGLPGHLQTKAGPRHSPGQLELAMCPVILNLTGLRVAVGSERVSAFVGPFVGACWQMIFHHLGSSNNFSLRFYENSFLLCPVLFDHCFPEGWPLGSQSNLLPGQPVGNALRNFSEDIGHGVSTSNGQDTGQECT